MHFFVDKTKASMFPTLFRLMHRPTLPRHCRAKPEETICIDIANRLRKATLENKLKAVWTHVPHEGKRHPLVGMILKAVGLIGGFPDYVFIWDNGGGLIEIKTPKGRLSDYQKDYQAWCKDRLVRHAICTSADDVMFILKEWGILDV